MLILCISLRTMSMYRKVASWNGCWILIPKLEERDALSCSWEERSCRSRRQIASLSANLLNTDTGSANRTAVRIRSTCRIWLNPKHSPVCKCMSSSSRSSFEINGKAFKVLPKSFCGWTKEKRGSQFQVVAWKVSILIPPKLVHLIELSSDLWIIDWKAYMLNVLFSRVGRQWRPPRASTICCKPFICNAECSLVPASVFTKGWQD